MVVNCLRSVTEMSSESVDAVRIDAKPWMLPAGADSQLRAHQQKQSIKSYFFPCIEDPIFLCAFTLHSTYTMSQRAGLRLLQASKQATLRTSFRQTFFRRNASTTADATATEATANQSGFAKLWNSPVGPKTVHFWYATMRRQIHTPATWER
jgi:hypothetical protein